MALLGGIEPVEVHDLDEEVGGDGGLVDEIAIYAHGVAHVLDLHGECRGFERGGSDGIDILHHEVPRGDVGISGCRFQELEHKGLGGR